MITEHNINVITSETIAKLRDGVEKGESKAQEF